MPPSRVSGTPGRTPPVAGSDRRSERLSRSSTKYGPSVSAGVTTHGALVDEEEDDVEDGDAGEEPPQPRKPTATNDPRA